MAWFEGYQLVLFDFDGLLVNTEELHFLAYKRMCAAHGFNLDWTFDRYVRSAHYSATAVKEDLYRKFPTLKNEAEWEVLYQEKKRHYIDLLRSGQVSLMPGVEKVLKELEEAKVNRCVVTHSALDLIQLIRSQHPILNTIPHWITREDYGEPKPHSECYLFAISKHASDEDRVIGFEDTPRGIQALLGTRAQPVLIADLSHPGVDVYEENDRVIHFPSLQDLPPNSIGSALKCP